MSGLLSTARIACSNASLLTGLRRKIVAPARIARRSSTSLARALRKINRDRSAWFQRGGGARPNRPFPACARPLPGRPSPQHAPIGGNPQPIRKPRTASRSSGGASELTPSSRRHRPRSQQAALQAFDSLHSLLSLSEILQCLTVNAAHHGVLLSFDTGRG